MKQGSTDDPFADEPERAERGDDQDDVGDDRSGDQGGSQDESSETGHSLPWIYRRDGVQSSRDQVIQLHLLDDTLADEEEFAEAIENELGEDVYLADLREAALLAAMDNLDDVAQKLREWGYDANG